MQAPSTIAMTVYNALAVAKMPTGVVGIIQMAAQFLMPLKSEEVEAALGELLKRDLVRVGDDGHELIDTEHRIIVARDRSDAGFDDDDLPTGGWNGWMVRDLAKGRPVARLLSEVLP